MDHVCQKLLLLCHVFSFQRQCASGRLLRLGMPAVQSSACINPCKLKGQNPKEILTEDVW